MKNITLTQDEFIVLARLMKSEKLLLYAGTGLESKNFTQKLEDKNFEVTNLLIYRGFVSMTGDDVPKSKVIFNRGIFIFKNKNNYVLSDDVQVMKNCSENVEYEIDVLENENDYSICVNKIIASLEGYMSISFNKDSKEFHLEIANRDEKLMFFSKQLQIPLTYTLNEEDTYIVSLKSSQFEKLIIAYTSNDMERYTVLANELGWNVKSSMDFLKSTWENDTYTNYISFKKKNELSTVRIYKNLENYFSLKTMNSKKEVQVAKQGLNGIIEFIKPYNK